MQIYKNQKIMSPMNKFIFRFFSSIKMSRILIKMYEIKKQGHVNERRRRRRRSQKWVEAKPGLPSGGGYDHRNG
jgi:hypothetical protein